MSQNRVTLPLSIRDKIATIVPKSLLGLTKDDRYFMALTHAADDPDYFAFFKARADEGKYVVFDNSTVELGEPEETSRYIEKAVAIGASEILLPDWLHNAKRTLYNVELGLDSVAKLGYEGHIMVVPQGRTQSEWLDCARTMLKYGIDTLGISCRYTEMFGGSRVLAAMALEGLIRDESRPDVGIHLLGCWANPAIDVAPLLQMGVVIGVDSSLPCTYANHGMIVDGISPRPVGGMDILTGYGNAVLVARNIERWKLLCEGRETYVENVQ